MAYFCSHPANFLSIPRCDVNATFRTENGFISINKQFNYESRQRIAYKKITKNIFEMNNKKKAIFKNLIFKVANKS